MTLKSDRQLLTEMVIQQTLNAGKRYHQLVLILVPPALAQLDLLSQLAKEEGHAYVNVSLALSQRLLEYTKQERVLNVASILDDLVSETPAKVVILDNIEALFEPSLKQDPLRCLERLSRNRTIVSTWRGGYADGCKIPLGKY